MPKMKVLMVSEYFPPYAMGGGEHSAFLLAKNLAKDIDISVLTSWFPGLKNQETMEGIKVIRKLRTGKDSNSFIGNFGRLFFERSLKRELPKIMHEYDIIHCMNITSIPAVEVKENVKFIAHVNSPGLFCPKHTLLYKDKEPCERECTRTTYLDCFLNSEEVGKMQNKPHLKYNPLFIYLARKRFESYQKNIGKFDLYMATSEFMKERLVKIGIDKKKIEVVPNIVEFKPVKRKKNKIPHILYVGAYLKSKGPQLLIEALRKVNKEYRCNFYGSGYLKDYLLKKVKEYNLNVQIHDPVPKEKMPEIYASHDLVVVPSLVGEAFNRVVVEAKAAGCEVIASDVGGMRELVGERTISDINLKKLLICMNRKLICITKDKNKRCINKLKKEKILIKVKSRYTKTIN